MFHTERTLSVSGAAPKLHSTLPLRRNSTEESRIFYDVRNLDTQLAEIWILNFSLASLVRFRYNR